MDNDSSMIYRLRRRFVDFSISWLVVEAFRLVFSRARLWPLEEPGQPSSHVEPVALLIDGDNISPELVEQILIEAGKLGGVTVKRVYGNWTTPFVQKWKSASARYGIRPMHLAQTANGKNATDIAMAIDAMDLLYRGTKHFCLVTSDSDFTPLVLRLREAGCTVHGIGRQAITSLALKNACTTFTSIEQLESPAHQPKYGEEASSNGKTAIQALPAASQPSTSQESTSAITPKPPVSVATLINKAYDDASKGKDEWVLLSRLGLSLRKFDPNFDVKLYAEDLTALIRRYDSLFEVRKRANGHPEMRRKTLMIA